MPIATRNGSTRSKAEAPALLVWFLTSPFAGQPMVLFGACVQTPSQCFVLFVTFIERQRRKRLGQLKPQVERMRGIDVSGLWKLEEFLHNFEGVGSL